LLTCHDEEFCGWMNDIDFFEDGGRVVRQGLFSQMVYNELETAVWTKGCSDNFCEFVNGVDIAQDG